MASQRVFQLGLRRAAAAPSFMKFQPAGRMVQRRLAATQTLKASEGNEILIKQRVQRPVSPHLAIYRPQITWYGSAFNRLTGVVLSGGLYLFGIAYLAAPALGWHLETQSLVAAVAAWPVAVKVAVKGFVALPFFYHSLNGFRHLAWDLGIGFKNKVVIQSGWTVVGLTVVSTLYYTFFA
ncbi:mitochondrial succinate dehydrogenase cytochrome b560 subunit C [Dendryphion nanum]|uniref:Mitochondrial succinate dehydrogenase cytochrome b560 subunit C n=1 Tax=Dendryphion nanum TaxID=256645 RepID=A0A9P9EDZ4_9PLEO|nr:mitochondrial succinate dehydrogenase cytochrome b560 subunit C [Dendryphion nanum]